MHTLDRLDTEALRASMRTFRDVVRDHAPGLNRLNVYPVPDGDTGTNMARTLDAVVAEMDVADGDDRSATCDAISHGSLMGARGNSGVILSQIMRGIAGTFKQHSDIRGARFADALQAASAGAYEAVRKPIEGTILTVCRESAEAARETADGGGSLVEVVRAARAAGKEALDNTPEQLAVLKDAGVVDAGGAGFLLLLDSVLHVVDGVPLPLPASDDAVSATAPGPAPSAEVGDQRYEVMYFLDLPDDSIRAFTDGWDAIGDSIVVVGGDGLWNCHVHTNDIGKAIEVAIDLGGRPRAIRVTDLFEEVGDEHARRESELTQPALPTLPAVTTAVVAVGVGDGIVELFAELGVQGVVTGGQTMNPSTAELLAAVDAVNAEQVAILPNNKNIVAVAEQVDALTDKMVCVVPTRSIVEALAALVVYDAAAGLESNGPAMSDAAASVKAGEVIQAVRDSTGPAGPVCAGAWVGLAQGDGIVAVAPTATGAAIALLDRLVVDGAELVTIILGADADEVTTAALHGWLGDHHRDVAVETHRGGQPLYPYLFGVE